jgi:L-alanine-DL-glutamate epimerase-like enolase superfamily enzyme
MNAPRVQVYECRVPLPSALELGNYRIEHRDYTIVRLSDEAGEGVAWSYSRGADIASCFRRQIEPLLGAARGPSPDLWERIHSAHPWTHAAGVFLRALSLADIALWQFEAAREGKTLAQKLGVSAPCEPAGFTVGCCYPARGRTPRQDAEEAAALVRKGYPSLKLCAADGGREDTERIRAVRSAIGPDIRLQVDLHWLWKHASDAAHALEQWRIFDLEWIEDPFPVDCLAACIHARERSSIPFAWGDEQNGRFILSQWIDSGAIDVLRLDATVVGGLTEFLRIGRRANQVGLKVSGHVFDEYHGPALAALADTSLPERFDPGSGLDPIQVLRQGPGWDWDAVLRHRINA